MGHLVVHFVAAVCATLVLALVLLGWRDRKAIDLADQLAVVMSIFSGIVFGVVWKLVEFVIDWARYSDIQKSNSDTMTDLLWNDIGAVVAALLAARLYCHALSASQRAGLGAFGAWVFGGPSRVLDRHGVLVTVVFAAIALASVAGLWFAGRPMPGIPNG